MKRPPILAASVPAAAVMRLCLPLPALAQVAAIATRLVKTGSQLRLPMSLYAYLIHYV
jgi:hypothetical protein